MKKFLVLLAFAVLFGYGVAHMLKSWAATEIGNVRQR